MELMNNQTGMVYLVGAGPGDPGLITVRGRQCLEKAEVVIYDRLSAVSLLELAPAEAIMIDVGKAPGDQPYSQEAINQILVKYGSEGKLVVRLKGGDPFLFGRGGEEALALKEAKVPYIVIPGVTSALAAPAYAGIPVTHRGISASVTIVTGHEMLGKEQSDINWEAISRSAQTLVILMGTANLSAIVQKLKVNGLAGTTPVVIIENGTTAWQRVIRGELQNIFSKSEEANLQSPAVIVIGAVAGLSEKLDWVKEQRPLLGKKILITRPAGQITELAGLILQAGGEPLICPTIKVEEIPVNSKKIIEAVRSAEWLVFTSVNGVEGFFKILRAARLDSRFLHHLKVAVIGEKTGEVLIGKGIIPDFQPSLYTSSDLCRELGSEIAGRRVVLLRVNDAPRDLADGLRGYGGLVEEYPVYEVRTETRYTEQIIDNLKAGKVSAVLLTSPSTVKGLLENIDGELELFRNVSVICIGPVTAKYAAECGIRVDGVAENSSNEEMVKVLIRVSGS